MKQILFLLLITLCSCHSTTSKKGQENEADSSLLQEKLYPDSIFKFKPIPTKEEQEQPSETTSFVLQPVPRDIPTGEAVSPTSLSMQTEYDYYPLSTTEVKLTVTNYPNKSICVETITALPITIMINDNGKHCQPTRLLKI